jgi:homoserine O-acetyltransferase
MLHATAPPGPRTAKFDAIELDSGRLSPVQIAYECYGQLNEDGSNAILICHALTGSAHAGSFYDDQGSLVGIEGWWDPLIGSGRALDTNRFFVLCSNFLGGCYGSTGPTSLDPRTGRPYGPRFPAITVRDMVRAQRLLLETLGVTRLLMVTGGSLGGFQVLEWAAMYPEMVRSIMPIATSLAHSAWCIAFNQVAREAIRLDPAFHDGDYAPGDQPLGGLEIARQIAMISYRSGISFQARFARQVAPETKRKEPIEWQRQDGNAVATGDDYEVSRYLRYQGRKLAERFDANTYITITEAMDRHDVGAGRGSAAQALLPFRGPAVCLGIDTDILYPTYEQHEIVQLFRTNGNDARYVEIASPHGHDAFLIEFDALGAVIREFVAALPT